MDSKSVLKKNYMQKYPIIFKALLVLLPVIFLASFIWFYSTKEDVVPTMTVQEKKERFKSAEQYRFRSKIRLMAVEICFIFHLKSIDIDNYKGEWEKKSTINKAMNVNAVR